MKFFDIITLFLVISAAPVELNRSETAVENPNSLKKSPTTFDLSLNSMETDTTSDSALQDSQL